MRPAHRLARKLQLTIHHTDRGNFAISAADDYGTTLPADRIVSFFFFADETSLFGLTIPIENNTVILHPHEWVQAFSGNRHPFVEYSGATDTDEEELASVEEAAKLWHSKELWTYTTPDAEQGIHFAGDEAGLSETASELTKQAIASKFQTLGVGADMVAAMLPHLQEYGWPGETKSDLPVRPALRLTEPDAEGTEDWLLETVILNERGTQWIPAKSKRNASIENALPAKWKPFADAISEQQSEMISFLQSVETESENRFLYMQMSDPEVRMFIQHDLPLFQSFGLAVLLPSWLKTVTETKMKIRTDAGVQSYKSAAGLDEVLSFDWSFSLAGNEIDRDTFQKMVDENREFIRTGDEWFHIDPTWLKRIKELMEQADNGEWTVKDLLFQELPEEIVPADEDEFDEDPLLAFTMQQSLRQYVDQVMDKKGLPHVQVPEQLQTELRPYQQEGFNWLMFMREQKFGACLADDMGLGKTVQLISYLLNVHSEPGVTPSLIICPTSVLGNWQKELERFAPSLKAAIHYGPGRLKEDQFNAYLAAEKPDVVLTTYGTATQDSEFLTEFPFASITLDEAQNIKNMQTKQSRAIRKLRGGHHIALTGTPIENRLAELWAIFDFIHRGYFGNFRRFTDDYIIPIERDDDERTKSRLRSKIHPFLLRRTKSDPDLQLNLPKKLEQNEYVPLTSEQAALYESFIEETKFKLQTLSGFERKGLILKMLSRLKQLCNHPALFLKEPFTQADVMLSRSDKLERIVKLAAEIAGNGEQCLIFTQYIGMGQLIRQCLTELYGYEVPFLTGSMPKGQRDHLVEAFQKGEFPIFILSLKAGGTGLNLTAANHVLHADRWWNPAVENQATDRAYRIGQEKFVHVHKFVTIGTIEEKIDKMLEEKAALSADLIQSSQWLTDLSDRELDDLLSFG
ncbi:DEAD/DEAH box helicase [Sporosarcina aquimarina]|uniref:DEAD/DEAH box helicase n=1 Tax=Sporosarcina aquimarina TaxID=114975 RepID=A0ABU4FVC9_9BACL|nr:DEAD/DEAH box helicase [Sporosarcina aquimarina]MDW0108666.1 DEAD/DEAH box helicase [Sporosarcina aquimarina]